MDTKNPKTLALATTEQQLHRFISVGDGTVQDLTIGSAPTKIQFTKWNMVAFAFVICNSWAGVAGSIQLALLQGGPATLIYSIVVSSIAYMSIAISMAELASVYPTAGGQYHFASILAPKKIKQGISYACGLLSIFSWTAIGAAVTVIPAQQIMALVAAFHPGFETKEWHVLLIYQAMALFVLLNNLFLLKKTPWTHNVGFALTLCLFLASFVALLVRSSPKAPSSFVWATFINYTGWPDGVCFIIGLSTSCVMYIGLDASMHIAEECKDPSRTVPTAMVTAVLIGCVTAFAYTVAQLYALTDIEAIMTTTEYIPWVVMRQGLRSTALATAFIVVGIVMTVFILNAVQETSSRLAWSFARDNGLVFSSRLCRIHPTLEVPVYALLLTYAILVLCGCIFVASTTAFNALISSSIVLQQLSFVIPVALLLYRRRGPKYLPRTRFFAPPPAVGWIANVIVVAFSLVTTVFFNMPAFLPTSASSMNYTCVILGIALLLGIVNWFAHARRHYQGPTITFENEGEGTVEVEVEVAGEDKDQGRWVSVTVE
ncbi:hypothetical protein Z517_04527 [Fonsecaea pedrosoi CBS 271.37]|uniref:Amino acid permease/ SLC12A domain-containing protein n=1 Tax=Fonsecaea pedrosoi CBS 271.37 TaxID=1442368 RepID=A0A0D2F4G1_9EURO|nr:uncharacterized protein Z517_04527 [Fonsecaea pedrosoi CBS 271.37]KIW81502.1 hypothetical protein Z517_04527 [Fonsecaea pedrosoi CBS 271.37]